MGDGIYATVLKISCQNLHTQHRAEMTAPGTQHEAGLVGSGYSVPLHLQQGDLWLRGDETRQDFEMAASVRT